MQIIRRLIKDSVPMRSRMGRSVCYAVLLLLMVLGVLIPAVPVHAINVIDDYPWKSASPVGNGDWGYTTCPVVPQSNPDPNCRSRVENGYGVIDPYNYFLKNCTSWAAWRLDQHGISMGGSWGNATNWYNVGASKGYKTDTTPGIGAVAWWSGSNTRHPTFGHVGYVEDIPGTNQVTVSQYNAISDGNYSIKTYDMSQPASSANDKPDGFIHFELGSSYAPGGSWLNTTRPDLSYVLPGSAINLQAQGVDSVSGTGLNKINVTTYTPGPNNKWGILTTTYYVANTKTGNAGATLIMPNAPYVLASFDVFGANGSYRLAPSGIRKYCNTTQTSCAHINGEAGVNLPGQGGSVVCTDPPQTSSNVTGATPGNNGWWRSTASVTLSAYAPCGGSGPTTYYTVNGGSQNTYNGPITLNQEGIYNVNYYSVDAIGNTESTKSTTVKIDWTPPVTAGTATGPRDTNGLFRNNVTVGLNGTDNLSGVDYEKYSLNGGTSYTTLTGATNTFPITGNGVSRALYYSTDIAGNIEQPPKDSGPIIINKYTIFANNSGQSLRFLFNGGSSTVTGDIFTNGTANIDWDTGSSFGTTFSTVGTNNTIGMYNTGTTIPTIQTGVQPVPMLSYPLSLYQSLATVVFPSSLYMDSVSSSLKDTIYVNGNVDMFDVGLGGSLSIVATGSINDWTTDSSYSTNDPNNGVLLYAGQNININSTGNRNLGLMYAPQGTVKIDGATGLTLNGSLVGDQVEINSATGFNLSYSPAFASSSYPLPLAAMGLVKPTGTIPPLAGVPTGFRPTNGASVNKTGVLVAWNSVSGAVGYQLQIAKSSSFSSVEYDISTLSAVNKAKLTSSATTYYWRVRSINRAGMSAWSPTGNFRTQ
jgi:surface antigen